MYHNIMRHMGSIIQAVVLFALISSTLLGPEVFAQEHAADHREVESPLSTPTPYTTQRLIDAEALDQERTKALAEFLSLPIHRQKRTALPSLICKSVLTQPTPSPHQLQIALAVVETDLSTEVTFQSPTNSQGQPPVSSNYMFDFSPDAVSIRSSTPRYESQALGISVPFAPQTKSVWVEAKNNMSILFLVPPVGDCGFQFLVACPRNYSNSRSLEDSHLEVTGVRYDVGAKADGLFQAPPGRGGKVWAGILGSSRISLPATWSTENTSAETPNTSIKVRKEAPPPGSPLTFHPASAPFADAVEARLEFGIPESVERTVRARSTLDLSRTQLVGTQKIEVENSEVSLAPGACFVITQRKETHY